MLKINKLKAYKKWEAKHGIEPLLPGLNYTQDQLFFINFGQVWCGKHKESVLRKVRRTFYKIFTKKFNNLS